MKTNEIKLLENYLNNLSFGDELSKKLNINYFKALFLKHEENIEVDIKLSCPEKGIDSNIIPFAIASSEDLKDVSITHYSDLKASSNLLKDMKLKIVKMHAGLGSSVKRADHLLITANRESFGSKGTDLYLNVQNEFRSMAELQYIQVQLMSKAKILSEIRVQCLVNEETYEVVNKCREKVSYIDHKKFSETILEDEPIYQFKVPTIDQDGNLTLDRVAPAGHAFLGFYLLSEIFNSCDNQNELITIGNGEDLNSVADDKILTWMLEKEVPIAMITTTKLAKDKKGGQISLVKAKSNSYVTIIEKAQAEKANQLEYFEQLGLREDDNLCLFNTNIVVINRGLLKSIFNKYLKDLSADEFEKIMTPELIRNTKVQGGKEYIQLEGAIGSLMLNLDKYMRLNFDVNIVKFLNLNPREREQFFIPIKKMKDFDELQNKYIFNEQTGRLDLKDNHE